VPGIPKVPQHVPGENLSVHGNIESTCVRSEPGPKGHGCLSESRGEC
jgi:hypothetical protein